MTFLFWAGAALRALFLTSRSLWFDEATSIVVAGAPLVRVPGMVVRNEVSPPLYHLLMHGWLQAFSDPLLGLRVFSMLCGVGALAAFGGLARRALPARAQVFALYLAAFSSYWIHLSQEGRFYGLLLLVVVLEARVVLALGESETPQRWAAYAALAVVGLYTHYYFAVVLAAHAAWLFWAVRGSPSGRRGWLAAHAVIALLLLPWLGPFLAQFSLHRHDPGNGDPLTLRQLGDLFGTLFCDVSFLGLLLPWRLIPALGAGFGLVTAAGAARASRRSTPPAERRVLGFALAHIALPVALVALVELAAGRPVTQARFFAPLSPYVYLVTALVLSALGRAARAAGLACALVVAAGTACYFCSIVLVDPRFDRLSDSLRGVDSRLPLVYLESYYYLPMRVYYLPERAHYLLVDGQEHLGLDYHGLPPYDAVVTPARLRGLGPCVVMDEQRLVSPVRFWVGSGRQLAELWRARVRGAAR